MEYKVGKIEGDLGDGIDRMQKFIVYLDGDSLTFYANETWRGSPSHKDIAMDFHLNTDNVIGGGYVFRRKNEHELVFASYSSHFDGVPEKVLEKFGDALFNAYRAIDPEIESIQYMTECNRPSVWNRFLKTGGGEP